MGGRRILSDPQIEQMIALRERGWSPERIANHFTESGTAISRGSISWQCLIHGADVPAKFRNKPVIENRPPFQRGDHLVKPYSSEDDTLLRVLDMQDFSIAVISKRMGRRPNSIRGRLATLARRDARAEEAQAA